jgi:hypothetical protein
MPRKRRFLFEHNDGSSRPLPSKIHCRRQSDDAAANDAKIVNHPISMLLLATAD